MKHLLLLLISLTLVACGGGDFDTSETEDDGTMEWDPAYVHEGGGGEDASGEDAPLVGS